MGQPIVSIPIIIAYAKISQFLAANDVSKTMLFKGGKPPVQRLPGLLYIVRKSVEWLYNIDPNNSTLPDTANYLYALCGKYLNQAKTIIGNTGGTIIVPGGTGGATLSAVLEQFRIGDPGALMIAGQTVLVISTSGIVVNTVSVDLDGIELPINDSTQVSYTVVYITTDITLTFNQGCLTGQLYIIRALRLI